MAERKTRKKTKTGEDSLSSFGYSTESDSSSASYISSKFDRKFPVKASEWKIEHLSQLGICYDEKATDLPTFMSLLKTRLSLDDVYEVTKIHKTLIQFTKECWKFSFDFDKESLAKDWSGIKIARKQSEKAMKELQEEDSNMVEQFRTIENFGSLEIYHGWKFNVLAFLRYFCKLLARWDKPLQREGRFTYLFMAFSKICFLDPEPGETYCESLQIKQVIVHGIPDIRFIASTTDNKQLAIVTEVKQNDAFRGDYQKDAFTYKNVSKRVLGRHGVELLMERKSSFFMPCVVGFLCIGTKVIFTFLQIDQAHYMDITEKGEVNKTSKASVSYTRPYDFMDVSDRAEILEPLFWFGFVQLQAENCNFK